MEGHRLYSTVIKLEEDGGEGGDESRAGDCEEDHVAPEAPHLARTDGPKGPAENLLRKPSTMNPTPAPVGVGLIRNMQTTVPRAAAMVTMLRKRRKEVGEGGDIGLQRPFAWPLPHG